jgi:phage tail-like protein
MKPSEIQALLPAVCQRAERTDPVQDGMLAAMHALHEPCEQALAQIERNFAAWSASDRFLTYLSSWVTMEPELATGQDELRALIAGAAELARRRGTLPGLRLFLETATGTAGFEIFENVTGGEHAARAFHLRVCAPAGLKQRSRVLRSIIERGKPAYVTYELDWTPR